MAQCLCIRKIGSGRTVITREDNSADPKRAAHRFDNVLPGDPGSAGANFPYTHTKTSTVSGITDAGISREIAPLPLRNKGAVGVRGWAVRICREGVLYKSHGSGRLPTHSTIISWSFTRVSIECLGFQIMNIFPWAV